METSFAVAARPRAFALVPDACALVLIDMQRDFLEAGGFGESLGNPFEQLRPAIAPCQRVLAAWRAAGLCVVHTREGHLPDLADLHPAKRDRSPAGILRIGEPGPMGRLLVRGEPGHALIPELTPFPGEIVIDKPGKGAFYATDLEARLRARQIRQLVVAGVTTEICVQATVREANDRGFECLVLADATASYSPEFHTAALDMITAQNGILGWVAETADLLAVLEKRPEA
jgi:nicotinamidase-related amidase